MKNMLCKYFSVWFFIFLYFSYSLFFQIHAIQKKAGVGFEKELNVSEQKVDKEIIVEGTDEFLFFSTKSKVKLEPSAFLEKETWKEQGDKILVGESYLKKKSSDGFLKFSYGNRNYFDFMGNYYGKVSNTFIGLEFSHNQFSHIDLKQEKNNSEQADTSLNFFSRSRISKKYYIGFSFLGHNTYNRLQNVVPYSNLHKRLFTFGLAQEIFVTPFSRVLIDLDANYAQSSLLPNAQKKQIAQLGRAETKITWIKTFKNGGTFELFALGGFFSNQQFFTKQKYLYYSLFSLAYKAKIWQTFTKKNRLNWNGYITLQAQGGNYQNDYQAATSLNIESRLADWVSALEFSFRKKYSQQEKENMLHRYLLADFSSATDKNIDGFWKNKTPLSRHVTLEHISGATHFFQGKEFSWDPSRSIWYYQNTSYTLVYNKLGFLFEITPIFFWHLSSTYDYYSPNINQMTPLTFQTGFYVDSLHWFFSLDYSLATKMPKNFTNTIAYQKQLTLIHLLEFSLSWKINRQFTLNLKGKNLLNQKYYWLAPFYEPELTVHFGLEIHF